MIFRVILTIQNQLNLSFSIKIFFIDLAESDLVYTETLIQRGKIDYSGKDVLILGAGDGALLWELLKENPNKVTMVEVNAHLLLKEESLADCASKTD